MTQQKIDQTVVLPDGSVGVDAFTAFNICNENAEDAETRLTALETGGVDPALVASLQAGLASIGGDNLLMNSSFEQGTGTNPPIGWSVGSQGLGAGIIGRMYVPSVLPDSARAWRWELNNVPVSGYLEGVTNSAVQLPRVEPGRPLNVTVSVRGTAGARWFLQVAWLDSNNVVMSYQGTQGTQTLADELWARKSLTIAAAPSGAVSARVYIRIYGLNLPGQWVEWDNASLQIGSTATGYAPSVYEAINAALAAQSAASVADGKAVVADVKAAAADTKAANAGAAVDALSLRMIGRNLLINCGAPINQRGFKGGALAAGVYGYDRWKAGPGGGNVVIDPATGQYNHSSGPLVQVIENPLGAWGQPLFVSVENPSGPVQVSVGGATATISSGSGRRGVQVTPSGSGHMVVQLTATGVSYSRPKVERGTVATVFDSWPDALELTLCQRYYEKSYNMGVAPGTVTDIGRVGVGFSNLAQSLSLLSVPFKVEKRSTPAITVFSPNTANTTGVIGQDDGSTVPAQVRTAGNWNWEALWQNTPGRWGGFFQWTADAEI